MIKIEIKNKLTREIIFEYSKENNTLKDTVEQAVKEKKSLNGANLNGANLYGASLNGANLNGANLYGANLNGANLNGASLNGANLDGANLNGASLYGANLNRAVKIPIHCKWTHGITDNKIHIGCEKRSIEEWEMFFNSDEELETSRNTAEFKQIQAVFESYKAYLNFLNKTT